MPVSVAEQPRQELWTGSSSAEWDSDLHFTSNELRHRLETLAASDEDPGQFENARRRSLPSYCSSPGFISIETWREQERERRELIRRRNVQNSRTSRQYFKHLDHEDNRLRKWFKRCGRQNSVRDFKAAGENVKAAWIEQGIWKSEWRQPSGQWKHQEPLELNLQFERDSKSELNTDRPPPQDGVQPNRPERQQAPSLTVKSDDEKLRIAKLRMEREREREASRPYHQFIYQVGKERDEIERETGFQELFESVEIDAEGRENVKNRWIRKGSWEKYMKNDSKSVARKMDDCAFNFELSKEKQRLACNELEENSCLASQELKNRELFRGQDINTKAYENVKDRWIRWEIWNDEWGVLPGMLWMHEDPVEVELPNDPAWIAIGPRPGTSQLESPQPPGINTVAKGPEMGTEIPTAPLLEAAENASGGVNESQRSSRNRSASQSQSNHTKSGSLEASKREDLRTTSITSRTQSDGQASRTISRQKPGSRDSLFRPKDERTQPATCSRNQSSKVSKSAWSRKPPAHRRSKISAPVPANGALSSSGLRAKRTGRQQDSLDRTNAASFEPLDNFPPLRRSERISMYKQKRIDTMLHNPESSPERVHAGRQPNRIREPTSKQCDSSKTTVMSSSSPQGISKRQSRKATQEARKQKRKTRDILLETIETEM
ncbi:MAG: hypothetical protein M1837_004789 [Sclerophora amabilis]|nr:MAG: hypothetical protein M1837_004789 [Sclerophora amabilis]